MNNDTYHEESALEENFPGREKHRRDACVARVAMDGRPGLARSRDCAAQCFPRREGLTAARKIPFQSRRRRIKQLPFMNKPG
ncbi:MAG TPA: hypothetical protein VK437_00965 [Steroidobacteraceae bacterium]|nr:hypothetical protein [Steroidobacteraceae bacterium]